MRPIFNKKVTKKYNLWNREQYTYVLFTVSQITLFSNFFIKNGSYNIIYTFKIYFATMFSVSVFNFNKNKFNPNTPIVDSLHGLWNREAYFLVIFL